MKPDVMIIGAGLAGWSANRELEKYGLRTMVVEKSRGLGGRMATRRLNDGRADHGAQFFTARSQSMKETVKEWEAAGYIRNWSNGFIQLENLEQKQHFQGDGHPRYVGHAGMAPLMKNLWKGKTIEKETKITTVVPGDKGWLLHADTNQMEARAVLLTSPVPQSLEMLQEVPGERRWEEDLSSIRYDPCLSVMIEYEGESPLVAPGGIQTKDPRIQFIGCNYQKGISDSCILTVHAEGEWSREHWDDSGEVFAEELCRIAGPLFDQKKIMKLHPKRWRYAKPVHMYPDRSRSYDSPYPLAFAGDAFGEGKVEGAILSGKDAAGKIISLLQ